MTIFISLEWLTVYHYRPRYEALVTSTLTPDVAIAPLLVLTPTPIPFPIITVQASSPPSEVEQLPTTVAALKPASPDAGSSPSSGHVTVYVLFIPQQPKSTLIGRNRRTDLRLPGRCKAPLANHHMYQDKQTPTEYAIFYHDAYNFLKQHDPTSRVAIAAMATATPLRLRYLALVLHAYQDHYGIPPGLAKVADEGQRYTLDDQFMIVCATSCGAALFIPQLYFL